MGYVYPCEPHKGARLKTVNAQIAVCSRVFAHRSTPSVPCDGDRIELPSHPLSSAGMAGQPWQGGRVPPRAALSHAACLGQGSFGPDAMETGPGAGARPRARPLRRTACGVGDGHCGGRGR